MNEQKQEISLSESFWKDSKSICAEVTDYSWAIVVYGLDSIYEADEFTDHIFSFETPLLTDPEEEDIFSSQHVHSVIGINKFENPISVSPKHSMQKIKN